MRIQMYIDKNLLNIEDITSSPLIIFVSGVENDNHIYICIYIVSRSYTLCCPMPRRPVNQPT